MFSADDEVQFSLLIVLGFSLVSDKNSLVGRLNNSSLFIDKIIFFAVIADQIGIFICFAA